MSVRRLADEAAQPTGFAFTRENAEWAVAKMAEYPAGRQQSAVIPILWRAQEQEGWVTRPAIEAVAQMLGMAYIRVLEVATFYTQFLLKPVGSRAHILICGTTPCMLRGAEDLRALCEDRIHHEAFHTNDNGTLSWEEVECLGACVNAPMVMIGNDTYEDLTVDRFGAIIDAFEAGKGASVAPGTQIKRAFSAAEGGATTLLEKPTAERTYKAFPPPPTPAPGAAAAMTAAPAVSAAPTAPAPTTPGRKREVSEEAAPGLKGPKGSTKVSQAKAEGERAAANVAANADGKPNVAMRETATGSESPAGKKDSGKAVDKPGLAPTAAPASPAAARPTREKGGEPTLFDAPAGKLDDLKLISGVGPVLESTLHRHGLTTFAQVAALSPADITALEEKLNFKGRVARDNWIAQAAALAKGGEAEYVRVFGKKPR